jgi:hypothetical protein
MAGTGAEPDVLCTEPYLPDRARKPLVIGDLKLFEPKTMCPFIAVRDREER